MAKASLAMLHWRPVALTATCSLVVILALAGICRWVPPTASAISPEPEPLVEAALPPPEPTYEPLVTPPSIALTETPTPSHGDEPGTVKPAASAPLTGPGHVAFARPVGEPKPFQFKRRNLLSADVLSKQLLNVPELDLDQRKLETPGLLALSRSFRNPFAHAVLDPLSRRVDLHGLPLQMGHDCQLGKECAENLQVLSRKLRTLLGQSVRRNPTDHRLDATKLRKLFAETDSWCHEDALPTLEQMLQPEDRPVRLVLVELLDQIRGRAATGALARRAVFDLSPEVREAAVRALFRRPLQEARDVLLEGLRYPWAPAADHAAEALVALNDQESVPHLERILEEPDPTAPVRQVYHPVKLKKEGTTVKSGKEKDPFDRGQSAVVGLEETSGRMQRTRLVADPETQPEWLRPEEDKVYAVRELVRVNHLRNCLLCHAPAESPTDPVRGLVPNRDVPLPPSFSTSYYEGNQGLFVRADVTYLRQDFSVPQPVAHPGKWPVHQRYDYVVRTRYPTFEELSQAQQPLPKASAQREAVRFALRELTGKG